MKLNTWLKNLPYELEYNLRIAIEDKLYPDFESIPKDFAVHEAQYVLSCYNEYGHSLYEDDNKTQEIIKLKKYIDKFNQIKGDYTWRPLPQFNF